MSVTELRKYRKQNSAYNSTRCKNGFRRSLEENERSPLTIRNYLCDLDAFIRWFEFQQKLEFFPELVTAVDLLEYKRYLSHSLKPQSINRKLTTIKVFLNWAHSAGMIPSVPKIPKVVKENRRGIRWLNRTEQHALLTRVEQGGRERDLVIVRLLLNTGLRVSELCDLHWSDIKITPNKAILIVQSGKGAKRREIPLNNDARLGLLSIGYHKNRGAVIPIFVGQRGQLTPRGIQSLIEKYKGDLEDFSPHSLRHTFCKNLIDAGVGLEMVAALAGHESLETTKRYCEPSPEDLALAVALISQKE